MTDETRRTPDGRFTYLEHGPERAQPVVFLHGIGGGAELWKGQLDSFGRRYRTIAWNMPGYGGSAPLETASVGTYGDALAAFIAALRLDTPVLVGHSIGGMIVQSFLADGLGDLRAAVLAQTSPAFGGRDPEWARGFVADRLAPLDRGETMGTVAEASVAGMIGDDPDPDGVALARAVIAGTPPEAYRASTLAMIGFDRREALACIAVPTLLLSGSKDGNAPAATMAKMAEKIPGGEHVCLEGVGHLAFLERPAEFDRAVLDFLDRRIGREAFPR